ncbi:hypothetical protein PMIN03_012463 [Paraphaeosphaeria minitans]
MWLKRTKNLADFNEEICEIIGGWAEGFSIAPTYPDNDKFLRTGYQVYRKYKQYTQAVVLAIRLNDCELIEVTFNSTNDKVTRVADGVPYCPTTDMVRCVGRQRLSYKSA